ncbi:MAG: hypothetical protein CHACPFDD_02264 [Phycisphaerae bacterium]|nr:hypothetical protein [Phycisphaerae bacterium]
MARRGMTRRELEPISCATEAAEFSVNPHGTDRVRYRAYELYLERCRSGETGDALSDWVTAEHQLREAEGQGEQEATASADEFGGTGI